MQMRRAADERLYPCEGIQEENRSPPSNTSVPSDEHPTGEISSIAGVGHALCVNLKKIYEYRKDMHREIIAMLKRRWL